MSGLTREDGIRNECVRGSIGLASMVDKMRENRLLRFGHMMRGEETKTVGVIMKTNVEEKKRNTKKEMVGYG